MSKAKTSMADLNNLLFEELERITNEDLTGETLDEALRRSGHVTKIASQIVQGARVSLEAARLQTDYGKNNVTLPPMLTGEGK